MRRLEMRDVRPRKLAQLALIGARALPQNNKGVRRLAPSAKPPAAATSTARARVAIRESRIGVASAMTSPASVDDYGT